MSSDQMRAGFEAWMFERGQLCERQNGKYVAMGAAIAWEAWQASRAAVVVELPADDAMGACPNTSPAFDEGYGVAIKHCRTAIEAAGIPTK